jgi:hypothetical protein
MDVRQQWRSTRSPESEQLRHSKKIGFDTFRDAKPFYPEIEGAQRVNNGVAEKKGPTVFDK